MNTYIYIDIQGMPHTANFTFTWPAGPNDVIITGTFDDWKGSIPLVKLSSGSFEITVPFTEPPQGEDDRIYFKFIVDGDWTVSDEYAKTSDGYGFENNYIHIRDIIAADKSIKNNVKIPEAGGLTTTTTTATTIENDKTDSNNGTVHILPITQPNNNQNTFIKAIGGPGPVIPENARDIQAFSEIRDIDANELNDRLNKELKNKTKLDNSNELDLNIETDPHLVAATQIPSRITNEEQIGNVNEDANEYKETADKHDEIDQPDNSNKNSLKSQPRESIEESHIIGAKIPMVKPEEAEKSDKESEPITVQKDSVNKTYDNQKNNTSNKKTTKLATSSGNKAKEEQKKPKKGFLGRLKKMFS